MKPIDENRNKAILTTRYIIKNNSPVVTVIYDEDGDWQFLGAEEINKSDARAARSGPSGSAEGTIEGEWQCDSYCHSTVSVPSSTFRGEWQCGSYHQVQSATAPDLAIAKFLRCYPPSCRQISSQFVPCPSPCTSLSVRPFLFPRKTPS